MPEIETHPAGLHLEAVTKIYRATRQTPQNTAVDNVSFTLEAGKALALIGQSGSGKTTIARMITGIERPTSGRIQLDDIRVDELHHRQMRDYRSQVQMVFQDPYAALNPASTVTYTLTRPLVNFAGLNTDAAHERMLQLLEDVGLTPATQFAEKLPHELSGGQRQRVVVARALACGPRVIVADEPVSMLDVSLRAGILELLRDLRVRTGISLLYITHDLLSARAVADEFVVLHNGRIAEQGSGRRIMQAPEDEYTRRLIDAIPNPSRNEAA